ncbi:FeoA family protein [Parasporobacterium paucivorans]|uniref:Ferrous iron transport protein A n=1 Tax=Parasporobacterium paucivorans DSM 15970 TaxID=1122934 RepID=A0A1M6DNK8_9FIRM|nr:FeoA family protein [Parasporobacterium paucivorans]SHI74780.1 ferrous iron transport protein A [Parasporobacterium paucivorans DSM 15970]
MTLKDLKPGEKGIISYIGHQGPFRRRIMDMGLTPGTSVKVIKMAPLGDPIEINIRGYGLSLRKQEAENILIV